MGVKRTWTNKFSIPESKTQNTEFMESHHEMFRILSQNSVFSVPLW